MPLAPPKAAIWMLAAEDPVHDADLFQEMQSVQELQASDSPVNTAQPEVFCGVEEEGLLFLQGQEPMCLSCFETTEGVADSTGISSQSREQCW